MQAVIKKTLLLLTVIPLLIVAQSKEMSNEAAQFYNDGNKFLKTGNYTEALKKYNSALKLSDDFRIFYQKAMALKKLSKLNDAVSAFTECSKKNTGFAPAYNGLGSIYFKIGKYENAVENFKKFERLTKKRTTKAKAKEYIARAYTKLAMQYKSDGNRGKAISALKNAVKNHAYDAAYLQMAEIYYDQGKYNLALESADKALNNRKSISKGAAYFYKGLSFKAKKQKSKAIESFELGKKDPKYRANCEHYLKELKN